ncbi:hypothetical protein WT72_24250 [Burkholderia pseudomultivorans]|uniref:hypothetical protein n=1 Tax=Burkholderia pseudomultivorans TaxID=1207504 RepID=UPI00075B7102|nr:hypothetical protein [Burkholderia pseudomultivorans]KWI50287.1 hypothetical protein WT72_24250 [Burkholderia pseudomultivorans]
MAANKKPRKAYRPRVVRRTAGLDVLERRTPMDRGQKTDLGIAYYMALNEMTNGRGTEEHWSTVTCALNLALVIAETGPGFDGIGIIKSALAGAVRSRDRARRTGKWGFDGDALIDVRIALETHDAQMATVSKAAILKALGEVHRRIDAGDVFKEAA